MQLTPTNPLRETALEIAEVAQGSGWDVPPRLYALVRTASLVADEPALARELGVGPDDVDDSFTAVEQDDLPAERSFEDFVTEIVWPPQVDGTAVVLERLMLPPDAEEGLPADEAEITDFVADHPDRQEVRLTVAVTRDGQSHCIVDVRGSDELAEGPDLVPGLVAMLRQTLVE
ncbi:PPA1309 family protein [Mumia sp. DW29H23]|uniref:PPA1309 family protein n=1 Tax=Mumia sp. DW29H23 TaxID=3421241 RepID=UPI003D687E0B